MSEASSWAQEARSANHTIAECYQAVTNRSGEPGNWNGAKPVEKHLSWLTGRIDNLEMALGQRDEEIERLKTADEDKQ